MVFRMISFEPLWETMKKKASRSINLSKNTKSAPASWTDCAKTGMSAPTPSTSSAAFWTVGWKMWLPITRTRRQSCKARIFNNEKARFDG